MMTDKRKTELIDRYLLGKLNEDEILQFEEALESDLVLKEEVAAQKEVVELMSINKEREQLKDKLDNFHDKLDIEEAKAQIVRKENKKNGKVVRLFVNIAVAASVAVIAVLSTLYYSGWFDYGKHVAEYQKLRKVLTNISADQGKIKNMISSSKTKSTPKIQYNGTGFVISSNGYLVTNYHVVQNVDSVFISHSLDTLTRFRAKVVHSDVVNDIAVLQVSDSNFHAFNRVPYTFKEEQSGLGDYVFTLDYSKDDIVFGEGVISSMTGYNDDTSAVQISIPANPGISGAPLLDSKGNILGVISGKHADKEGAAFAIRTEFLLNSLDSVVVDSLSEKPLLPRKNILSWRKRPDQIERIRPFIYKVEVYKAE